MAKEQEPKLSEEVEIDLDALEPGIDENERRIEEDERREAGDRRILDRVVADKKPRRQNPDRRI
ncbi:MAG: hypothetical protein ACJAVI_003406 [Candidatus Azotimanducaceae bacterium]|jgi:hypothetical protein